VTGDKLLFAHPPRVQPSSSSTDAAYSSAVPFAVRTAPRDAGMPTERSDDVFCGLSDEILQYLFCVKPELCEQPFDLKINDTRFVGHPAMVHQCIR